MCLATIVNPVYLTLGPGAIEWVILILLVGGIGGGAWRALPAAMKADVVGAWTALPAAMKFNLWGLRDSTRRARIRPNNSGCSSFCSAGYPPCSG